MTLAAKQQRVGVATIPAKMHALLALFAEGVLVFHPTSDEPTA